MSFNDFYLTHNENPVLEFSPRESDRSGLRIGRLTCGIYTDWQSLNPVKLISESNFDLVIFRYPSTQVAIAQQLQVPELTSWIADTLIYFSVDVSQVALPDFKGRLELISEGDVEFDLMLNRVFFEYQNHYSANTYLASINVGEAYADWVRNLAGEPSGACYGYRNSSGILTGLGVLQSISEDTDELALV